MKYSVQAVPLWARAVQIYSTFKLHIISYPQLHRRTSNMIPNSPFNHYMAPVYMQGPPGGLGTPTPRGRGRGTTVGAKRGRKPRGALPNANIDPRPLPQASSPSTSQPTTVQWAQPITHVPPTISSPSDPRRTPSLGVISTPEQSQGTTTAGTQSQGTVLSLPGAMPILPVGASGTIQRPSGPGGADDDGDGDDELLPAMADDDFAAQSSWNSQSKDNLK
jgi:transcription initiation factor TFIID subunit 11